MLGLYSSRNSIVFKIQLGGQTKLKKQTKMRTTKAKGSHFVAKISKFQIEMNLSEVTNNKYNLGSNRQEVKDFKL